MKKVGMDMMVSLDREGPEGPDNWSWHVFDDAMEAHVNELADSLDLMIMGRLTFPCSAAPSPPAAAFDFRPSRSIRA
jgi:hypothetical protein